jgi:hypothetical protein
MWSKDRTANIAAAQEQFVLNAEQNELARQGKYDPEQDPRR